MINVTSLSFDKEVEDSVLGVIRSGNIAQGPKVREFEEKFAQLSNTKHAVALNNGTTSLIASLQVLGIGLGDEVITSPFTFIATINAILSTGATAILADINLEDFNIDVESIKSLITPRTKAIMPVHLYGQMANMIEIEKIAIEHNLFIVEDSAQSHGASIEGRMAGSFGLGSFSFYATKNLTTGEGGIITTNDDSIAEELRILRNQGMRSKYEYVMQGNNYRMTDLQAALVIPQLNKYETVIQKRSFNASYLNNALSDCDSLVTPSQLPGRKHVWHQFTIALEENLNRQTFVENMAGQGINVGIYYPALVCDYQLYSNHPLVKQGNMSNARSLAKRVVSLPIHEKLTESELLEIAKATKYSEENSNEN